MSDIQNIKPRRRVKMSGTDDPVALAAGWHPLKRDRMASFRNQTLTVHKDRIVIRRSAAAIAIYLLFAAPAVLLAVAGGPYLLLKGYTPGGIAAIIVGTLITFMSSSMFASTKNITIDHENGLQYSRRKPRRPFTKSVRQKIILADIYAIQIIQVMDRPSSGGRGLNYEGYELNLVFKSGARENLMSHGNLREIEISATQLAEFLNVSIWKAMY